MRHVALGIAIAGMALIGGISASGASAAQVDLWQSPSGNIRCGYADQTGIACYMRDTGRYGALRSFGGSSVGYTRTGLPGGRVLPYGAVWSRSTFRCQSRRDGMRCASSFTGHGFHISRESTYRW